MPRVVAEAKAQGQQAPRAPPPLEGAANIDGNVELTHVDRRWPRPSVVEGHQQTQHLGLGLQQTRQPPHHESAVLACAAAVDHLDVAVAEFAQTKLQLRRVALLGRRRADAGSIAVAEADHARTGGQGRHRRRGADGNGADDDRAELEQQFEGHEEDRDREQNLAPEHRGRRGRQRTRRGGGASRLRLSPHARSGQDCRRNNVWLGPEERGLGFITPSDGNKGPGAVGVSATN